MKLKKAIGIMSGTSLDAVDIALIKTDGMQKVYPQCAKSYSYTKMERQFLQDSVECALNWRFKGNKPEFLTQAENKFTEIIKNYLEKFLKIFSIHKNEIDLIGFHGQTLIHLPPRHKKEKGKTLQMGNGALLAQKISIPVINNFRSKDMKYGGQGAPLVPIYHFALMANNTFKKPVLILNIGGVANLTIIKNNQIDQMISGDTGPGNGPLDCWVELHQKGNMDQNGQYASKGIVSKKMLAEFKQLAFFNQSFPKSADRWDFDFTEKLKENRIKFEDGCATLLTLTVSSIVDCIHSYANTAQQLIIVGGGRHNHELIRQLKKNLKMEVCSAEQIGWEGDFTEAEAFAYLAVRSLKGKALTFPSTTGVEKPVSGGEYHSIK